MDQFNKRSATRNRRRWEPPAVKTLGTIAEIVRGGGAKILTVTEADPGDTGKPPGQE